MILHTSLRRRQRTFATGDLFVYTAATRSQCAFLSPTRDATAKTINRHKRASSFHVVMLHSVLPSVTRQDPVCLRQHPLFVISRRFGLCLPPHFFLAPCASDTIPLTATPRKTLHVGRGCDGRDASTVESRTFRKNNTPHQSRASTKAFVRTSSVTQRRIRTMKRNAADHANSQERFLG